MTAKARFYALIAGIARQDLREAVEDTALCNANDMFRGRDLKMFGMDISEDEEAYWTAALDTADLALDNARGFYPELFQGETK